MIELIKFKTDEKHDLRNELERADFRLRFIFFSWVAEVIYRYGHTILVTKIKQTKKRVTIYSLIYG